MKGKTMSSLSFCPSNTIRLFDENYVITELADNNLITLRSGKGVLKQLTLETLTQHYLQGNLRSEKLDSHQSVTTRRIPKPPALSLDRAEIEHVQRWQALLQHIEKNGILKRELRQHSHELLTDFCTQVGFKKTPSYASIRRAHQRYLRSRGEPTSLIRKTKCRGGKNKSRLREEVQLMLNDILDNRFLLPHGETLMDCYRELSSQIREKNVFKLPTMQLQIPSFSTLHRSLKRRPAFEVMAARHGRKAAERIFRSSNRVAARDAFMSVCEIDHTPLDLFVINETSRLPLGRPRLTVMIECKTKAIMGIDFGFDGNSAAAVLRCLKQAILPKVGQTLNGEDIGKSWPCFGIPGSLKCDNGKEFHSEDIERAALQLGMDLAFTPARSPWFKGSVERVLRTANEGFSAQIPGYSFGHFYKRKSDADPSTLAVITMGKLKELLFHWITQIYMPAMHKSIGMSPLQAWQDHFQLESILLPPTVEEIELACCSTDLRKLQHYGVDFCGLTSFNNPAIQQIRRRHQHDRTVDVETKYSSDSMSKIWVQDPDNEEWIEVLNSDPETQNLTEFQVRALTAKITEAKGKGTPLSIIAAKELLRNEVAALSTGKLQSGRRRAFKLMGIVDDLPEQKEKTNVYKLKPAPTRKNVVPPPLQNEVSTIPTFESVVVGNSTGGGVK
jgi:putative transposase